MTLSELAVLNQPSPTITGGSTVMVNLFRHIADRDITRAFTARYHLGIARYGTPLHTEDGRSTEADLLQELLDAVMYAHKGSMETNSPHYAQIRDNLLYCVVLMKTITSETKGG